MPKPCPCLLVTDCGKPLGDLLDSTYRAYGVRGVTQFEGIHLMPDQTRITRELARCPKFLRIDGTLHVL
jgi:hypothetical protein